MPPGNNLSAIFGGGGPPQMDTSTLNQILSPYGVQEPDSYLQPGPLENNRGFNMAHPQLASRLDNALIAVSLMGPTGATAGENISNAARGILGVGNYRRQFAAQQAAIPIEMAGKIAGLQHLGAESEELRARGEYYRNLPKMWENRDQQRLNAALVRSQIQGAEHPRLMKDAGGNEYVATPQVDNDGNITWQHSDIDPMEFKREQVKTKASNMFGGGLHGGVFSTQLAAKYGDRLGELMANPTAEFAKDVNQFYTKMQQESASYQGIGARNNEPISQSDRSKEALRASQKQLDSYMFQKSDMDPAKVRSALAPALLNSGATLDQVEAQVQAQIAGMKQHNSQLDGMWNAYTRMPPEFQAQYDFGTYASNSGYDFRTRHFQPVGGAPQQQPQAQQQGPMPGAPGSGLSPNVQAIINALGK